MRIAAVFVAAVCFFAACSTDECMDNQNSLPLAGFYSSSEKPQQLRVDSVTIYGVGAPGDSVLVDCGYVSQLYLPFRIDQEETTYVFRYDNKAAAELGLEDRITFRYSIEPRFVSEACGAVYDYKIRQIESTHVFIDTVTCPNGIIDNKAVENLKIFFKYDE